MFHIFVCFTLPICQRFLIILSTVFQRRSLLFIIIPNFVFDSRFFHRVLYSKQFVYYGCLESRIVFFVWNQTGTMIYICALLVQKFLSRRNLLKHNRKVHKIFCTKIRDERTYKCADCDYVCVKKIDIIRHVKSHCSTLLRWKPTRLICSECNALLSTYKHLR